MNRILDHLNCEEGLADEAADRPFTFEYRLLDGDPPLESFLVWPGHLIRCPCGGAHWKPRYADPDDGYTLIDWMCPECGWVSTPRQFVERTNGTDPR